MIQSICCQQNVLFPALTVEEHLVFFSRIKGISDKDIFLQIEVLILVNTNICNK